MKTIVRKAAAATLEQVNDVGLLNPDIGDEYDVDESEGIRKEADRSWTGQRITLNTREFLNQQWVVIPADWRAYPDWQACLVDHGQFLRRNKRYAACFACTTGKTFAQAVAKAGYATDPRYADKLIAMIDKYQLEALDPPLNLSPGAT